MDHAVFVSMLQAEGGLANDLAGVGDRQAAVLLEKAREVAAVDELHHEIQLPVGFVGVSRLDDVRMI